MTFIVFCVHIKNDIFNNRISVHACYHHSRVVTPGLEEDSNNCTYLNLDVNIRDRNLKAVITLPAWQWPSSHRQAIDDNSLLFVADGCFFSAVGALFFEAVACIYLCCKTSACVTHTQGAKDEIIINKAYPSYYHRPPRAAATDCLYLVSFPSKGCCCNNCYNFAAPDSGWSRKFTYSIRTG